MATTSLKPPSKPRKSAHARSVTRFCEEANLGDADQLDLAEFIVAARYLGTEADDDQLMNVFLEMEEANTDNIPPKEVIKKLMQRVQDEYGVDDAPPQPPDDDKTNADDDADEIVAINPLDAFSEDAQWQQTQLDDFLLNTQNDQNLRIARNLLETTALTRHEVAEITGVDAELLKDYESDDYETEDDEEEDDEDDNNTAASASAKANANSASSANKGVNISAKDFGKSIMLSKDELATLKQLLDAGEDGVKENSSDALRLLQKLNAAINLTPGHVKRAKTLAKLQLSKAASNKVVIGGAVDENTESDANVKLPQKYRVVIHPGALCKASKELSSAEVAKLPIGSLVTVEEIADRRARISKPFQGWCSLHASDGRVILQRANVKSALMDKAIHAERARQTKILILKSITTLNDATVIRILEKSEWNLRRAIEAFYIAKYKTQEYIAKKEQNAPASDDQNKSTDDAKKKKGKIAWWKSWKTFANEK
jgi:hypothetical protein